MLSEVKLVEGRVGRLPQGFLLSVGETGGEVRVTASIPEASINEHYFEVLCILDQMPRDKDRFLTVLLHYLRKEDFVFYPELIAEAIQAYNKGAGIKESWTTEAVVEKLHDDQAYCRLENGEPVWVVVGLYHRPKVGEKIKIKAIRVVNWYGKENLTIVWEDLVNANKRED